MIGSPSSPELLQSAFERAGCHPHVELAVEHVQRDANTVTVGVVLRYRAAHPICCAEPACYIAAFRPDGLAAICEQLRAGELDPRLDLKVVVTFALDAGFRFLEPAIGCADGAQITYQYPDHAATQG